MFDRFCIGFLYRICLHSRVHNTSLLTSHEPRLVYSGSWILLDRLEARVYSDHERTLHRVLSVTSRLGVDLQRFT